MLIGLILGITTTIGLSAYLFYLEAKAAKRNRLLKKADLVFTTPLSNKDLFGAAAIGTGMGGAATGISLYEFYSAAENHEEALEALSNRFNAQLADADSPLEWANYLVGKEEAGEMAISGVLNNIVGQMGEDAAVEYLNGLPELQDQCIHAELMPSRSHPDNDIQFLNKDGTTAEVSLQSLGIDSIGEVSVKSYEEMSPFLTEIANSNATAHVVNHELFQKLEESGKIDELGSEGIKIIDGGWSHLSNMTEAQDTFEAFSEAADVWEDVPLIALGFFGVKTFKNAAKLIKGKTTFREAGIDLAVDAARAVTAGAGGMAGGYAGAIIGTLFMPGVGTLIGGGIGVVAGAFGGSAAFQWLKNKLKYGKLMAALETLGELYRLKFIKKRQLETPGIALAREYLELDVSVKELEEEEALASKYRDEVKQYSLQNYTPPTPMGTLARRHALMLRLHIKTCIDTCKRSIQGLWAQCMKIAQEDERWASMMFGAVLSEKGELLFNDKEYLATLKQYRIEAAKTPLHPFQLFGSDKDPLPADIILPGLCAENYQPPPANSSILYRRNALIPIIGIALIGLAIYLMTLLIELIPS